MTFGFYGENRRRRPDKRKRRDRDHFKLYDPIGIPAGGTPGSDIIPTSLDKYETFIWFETISIVHSAANRIRYSNWKSNLEAEFKPGDSRFIGTDEILRCKKAVINFEFTANAVFSIYLVLSVMETGGTAFPASTEEAWNNTSSQQEMLDGQFLSNHDFQIWKRPLLSQTRDYNGSYGVKLTLNIKRFLNRVTSEHLSDSNRDKDYAIFIVTMSPTAQTISGHAFYNILGAVDDNRSSLL